ncbi:MAG: hypothetical protein MMC23_003498 [Stictis urceolatum]|nr:hypothetical protein [Stictis urceolata]
MSLDTEFNKALVRFKAALTQEEQSSFRIASLSDVKQEISRIETDQRKHRSQRGLRRLEPFINGLQRFSTVIEQFVQIKPDILAVIWGPIKLLLHVSHGTLAAFDRILDACRDIGELLPRFQTFGEIFRDSHDISRVLVWLFTDILEFYVEVLKLLRKKAWKQVFSTLWSGFADHFEHLQDRIRQHRDLVDVEVIAIDVQSADKFRKEARAHFHEEARRRSQRLLQEIELWLNPPPIKDIQRFENVSRNSPAKGLWLIENQIFKAWVNLQADSTLWLTGIPGCGKTILAFHCWVYLCGSLPSGATALAVFLSDEAASDARPHSASTTIASIISQLIHADTESLLPLAHSYIQRVSKSALGKSRSSYEPLLRQLLNATELSSVFMIIDGLDEIASEERSNLMRFLKSLVADHTVTRLLVSSRALTDIKTVLSERPTIRANDLNGGDISAYILSEKSALQTKFKMTDDQLVPIIDSISSMSKGMFLYAHLMMRTLRRQPSRALLKSAALNLPSGIEDAYSRIIRDVMSLEEASRALAVRILEFLTCVRSRPRLAEVEKTIMIKVSDRHFDDDSALLT